MSEQLKTLSHGSMPLYVNQSEECKSTSERFMSKTKLAEQNEEFPDMKRAYSEMKKD